MFKIKKLAYSFKHAFRGLGVAFKREQSFRVQLAIGFLVVLLMIYFKVHTLEKAILVMSMTIVLGMEILNFQLEKILDIIQPDQDPRIKAIKDLSAAAVLVAVFGSALVGIFIFLPYLV